MEIKYTNKELDKRTIYKHTRAAGISLKDVDDGVKIVPVEICIYEDSNSRGDKVTITSIVADDGKHYVTNSQIFRKELEYIIDLMKDGDFAVIVRKAVSKAGRTFVTCELA